MTYPTNTIQYKEVQYAKTVERKKERTCGECQNVRVDKYLKGRVICREGYGFRRFGDKQCHAFK